MKKFKYLIVGGGMTAAAAVEGIREVDQSGSVGLFSAEVDPPYDRPPLSKALWKDGKIADIWRKIADPSVDMFLNHPITSVNPQEKLVQDQAGNQFQYDKCLLATGGEPRRLPFGGEDILYYRTFADYEKLRRKVNSGGKFAVIGGGFIGSEIAAALAMNEQQVSIIFPEPGIGSNLFPIELAHFLNDVYRQKGVDVVNGVLVKDVATKANGKFGLQLDNGEQIKADSIIAGLGIKPAASLAENAGLTVDNGIVVNEYLQTSEPDIYAAGDVAAFRAPGLDARIRVEHEDNANTMGRSAGNNMAGKQVPYHYLPMFYSDLFEYGYEAVGIVDARLDTYQKWQNPYERGVIFYLDAGRMCGALLWNVWNKVDNARELIRSASQYSEEELEKVADSILAR